MRPMDTIQETTVQEANGVRYVEIDGVRYPSDELPSEGTVVVVDWAYTGINDRRMVDLKWAADSPTGQGWARIEEEY